MASKSFDSFIRKYYQPEIEQITFIRDNKGRLITSIPFELAHIIFLLATHEEFCLAQVFIKSECNPHSKVLHDYLYELQFANGGNAMAWKNFIHKMLYRLQKDALIESTHMIWLFMKTTLKQAFHYHLTRTVNF